MADAVLDKAVDLAREVAVELAEDSADVGDYLGAVEEADRLVSHRFANLARGYHGWEWTVTVARVPRGRTVTVSEAALLPGREAVLAKAWLPWAERLRPGDIGPGDVLPFRPDDPRLVPGWQASGDADADAVAIDELALARERILSPEGREEAAQRWYRGTRGPTSAGSLASEAACATCGFLVPIQGALGQVFGVCANEWSPDDGKVVSLDHGCGAHSQTDVAAVTEWPAPDPIVDDEAVEIVEAHAAAVEVVPEGSSEGPVGDVIDVDVPGDEIDVQVVAEGLAEADEEPPVESLDLSAEVAADVSAEVALDVTAPDEVALDVLDEAASDQPDETDVPEAATDAHDVTAPDAPDAPDVTGAPDETAPEEPTEP